MSIPNFFENRLPPDRGLANQKNSGVKGRKVRLTYGLMTNATGSERRPPFIIGKAARPRAFNKKTGAELGFDYYNSAKAWNTTILYYAWLRKWDRELQATNRKILLLQDNFSAHKCPDDVQNIEVLKFEPNLTTHVQSQDQGIIKCFKAYYRAKYIQRAIDRFDAGITPSEIYDINQLEAMRLADTAWHAIDASTIQHCWQKAGILPEPRSSMPTPSAPIASILNQDPIIEAEKKSKPRWIISWQPRCSNPSIG